MKSIKEISKKSSW
jgi:hypothetical protein